ncbi:MAG: hypothetical protein HOO96_05390 [Polyangiaceae bacterium]|nr:hypothetical protein [Polyangiaceae bacterium]
MSRFVWIIPSLGLAACSALSSNEFAPSGGNEGDNPISRADAGPSYDARTDAAAGKAGSPLCHLDDTTCSPDYGSCEPPSSGADGGSDASIADATVAPPTDACRLMSQGKDVVAQCAPAGAATDGAKCTDAADCAPGFECTRMGGMAEGQCRHYCCSGTCDNPASSGGKTFCDVQFTRDSSLKVPVCMPVKSCELLKAGACTKGETCAVVREDDGTTGCVEIGPALVGQSCDEVHCGEGLTCLGKAGARRCLKLCKDGVTTCAPGERCLSSPPTFKDSGLGVCVNPNATL